MSKEKTNTYREIVRSASQVQDQAFGFDNYHAFIVGINDYQFVPPLNTAVNDAQRLAKILADNHGYTVHEVLINPTGAALQSFLIDMKNKVGEKDAVLIYFAGHGIALEDEKGMNGYIVPADAKANDGSTLIPMQFLNECFAALTCRHFLLILDCCFAGSIRWASTQRNIDALFLPKRIYKERFERYIMDKAWQVLASASHDQKAFDSLKGFRNERDTEGLDHSPFALALFEALSGKADIIPADGGDGIITATELYLYLREEVEIPTLAANVRLRQTPSIFTLPNHDKGEFIFFAPNHRLNLPPIPQRNPFKGLQSFDEVDKELFYGRERVVKALLDKVTTQRLTIVTGASGTGKSSLVKAGLIPLLKENGFNVFPVIRPTQKPLEVLAQVNLPENKEKTVLVIDQFEELLTQSNDEDRLKFIEILRGCTQEGLTVIVTVRADFEPQFEMEDWAEWQSGRFVVPPFSVEELREVIVRPAVQEVLQFDKPKLIDQILQEVVQAPNALPLLSFTLSELYEKYVNSGRNDRILTENDYKSLGGVIGSLRKKADKIYAELEPSEQDAMRNMMLRMVSIVGGEYAGKRVFKTDFVFTDPEETKRIEAVIKKMEEGRLILSDKDNNGRPFVEPAHDALVRAWTKLREWVATRGEENVLLQNKLTEAVNDYDALKNKELLWHDDPRLEMLKGANDTWLNERESLFIQKSEAEKTRRRNLRHRELIIAFSVLGLLFLGAIYFAIASNKNAKQSQAQGLTFVSNSFIEKDQRKALNLASIAYNLYPTASYLQVLSAAMYQMFDTASIFYVDMTKHTDKVTFAIFSPDGKQILTCSEDKTAKLWNLKGELLADMTRHTATVYSAIFSPDGKQILTRSADKTAKLWNLKGELLADMNKHIAPVTSAIFSPDGKQILTCSEDKTAKLFPTPYTILEWLKTEPIPPLNKEEKALYNIKD